MAQTALILIVLTVAGLIYASRWLKSAQRGANGAQGAEKRTGQTQLPPLLNGRVYLGLLVIALILAFLWQ